MYIDDPFGLALGLPPLDYKPTFEQLLEEHPCTKHIGNMREGYITPEETRQKVRDAVNARKQDPEWLARWPEICAKMSASRMGNINAKGKKFSPEARERMRLGQLKRWADYRERSST